MSIFGVIGLGVLGLLGAYLFLIFGEQQQTEQQKQVIEHKIQTEKFDQDFKVAWNGKPLEDDQAASKRRVAALKKELADIKASSSNAAAGDKKREEELKVALDKMAGHQ